MISKKKCISFSDCICLINSADPDETTHYAVFHLGLHCLQKYIIGDRGLSAKQIHGLLLSFQGSQI